MTSAASHVTTFLESYQQQKSEALRRLPNTLVHAFSPVSWIERGFPTSAVATSELWKFVDTMHEFRELNDEGLTGRVSEPESELLSRLARRCYEISKHVSGIGVCPRASLIRMINIYRYIIVVFDFLQSQDSHVTPSILEIGPGSGHLSALLLSSGVACSTMDVTDGYVAWQSAYLTRVRPDLAYDKVRGAAQQKETGEGRLLGPSSEEKLVGKDLFSQLFWWDFADFNGILRKLVRKNIRIVTANHMLAEMHPDSLDYLLRLIKELAVQVGDRIFLVCESYGASYQSTWENVTSKILKSGAEPVFLHDRCHLWCMEPARAAAGLSPTTSAPPLLSPLNLHKEIRISLRKSVASSLLRFPGGARALHVQRGLRDEMRMRRKLNSKLMLSREKYGALRHLIFKAEDVWEQYSISSHAVITNTQQAVGASVLSPDEAWRFSQQ